MLEKFESLLKTTKRLF